MSSISTTGSSSSSITGQLDVQWIVEQIIYAKQEPIRSLETYEYFYQAKREAFQELNTRVSAVESALYTLKSSSFGAKSASLSTEDYLSATATTGASEGEYAIVVKQLAQAESYTSSSVSSADTQSFSNGKITFKDATGTTVLDEIDFSSGTMSLNQIKDAINTLDLGDIELSAAVVNFGTAGSPQYRLQVTADETGTANGFVIEESGTGTLPGFAEKVAAKDAQIYINVDPTAHPADYITRSTNAFSDVVPGVSITLNNADTTKTTFLNVTTDSSGLKENIQTFIDSFNEAINYLNQQFTYDEENERAGVLSGESTAVKVKQDLLSLVTSNVRGVKTSETYDSFSEIGLKLNRSGNLELDEKALDKALENDFTSVERVFRNKGTTTGSELSYLGYSKKTQGGEYLVHINQVAEQAVVSGSVDIAANLASDEQLTIWYGNSSSYTTVDLTSGMSTTAVVNAINTALDDSGTSIFARLNGSRLEIVSDAYGSSEKVSIQSNVAAGSGGTGIGTTQLVDSGQDVAGTIGGNAASGKGRILTGTAGASEGMILNITATTLSDAINGDDKGYAYFTRSVGETLRERMYEISFPYSGIIAKNIDALDDQLQDISDKIAAINRSLESEQEILITQFTKANEALAQMTYLQSTLSNNFKTS